MEKDRKFRALAIAAICIAVVGVSVAYAALAATLNINGQATINTAESWKIALQEPSTITKPAGVTADFKTKSEDLIEWTATFTAPKQSMSFTVDVKNEGSIDAVLNTITKAVNGTTTATVGENVVNLYTYDVKINDTSVELAGDLNGATRLAATKSFTVTVTVTFDKNGELDAAALQTLNTKTANFTFGMVFGQATGSETEIA